MQHQNPSPHPRAHPAHTSSPHPRSNGGMVDTKDLKSFGHSGRAGSSPASSTPTPPRPRVRSPHPPIPDPGPTHTHTHTHTQPPSQHPHTIHIPSSHNPHTLHSPPKKKPRRATHSRATSYYPPPLYHNPKPIQHPLNNPISIPQPLSSHTRPDPMLPISPQMIAQYRLMALHYPLYS